MPTFKKYDFCGVTLRENPTMLSQLTRKIATPVKRVAQDGKRRRRKSDTGVTLIEMMVVLVIIGIVAALVVPQVIGRPDQARVAVAGADLRAIASSLEMYRLDNRTYPSTAQGLAALAAPPDQAPLAANWAPGGYLSSVPEDPWGTPYVYRAPGQAGAYELISLGADRAPGGEGVDADIRYGPGIATAGAG